MPDVADALALLQRLDCETLSRVRREVDRILGEKGSEQLQRVEVVEPSSRALSRA
jgi:hypothetical protein